MATGPALHVVTKVKLVTAPSARAARDACSLALAMLSASALRVSRARARPLSVLPLMALALSLLQLVVATFTMAAIVPAHRTPLCLAGTTIASASLPLVPYVHSPEPTSLGATVAPTRATAMLHARGQAATPYTGMGSASRGCAMADRCHAGHPRRATVVAT
jgi:hypothetical protein